MKVVVVTLSMAALALVVVPLVGSALLSAVLSGVSAVLPGVGTVAVPSPLPAFQSAGPALASIPPGILAIYLRAVSVCPGLPWTLLAAIGTVESSNGTSDLPGVRSGANAAGAEGPMQFEPATFAAYALPVPPGGVTPPSPYDPVDAVYAAARMLCSNGAGRPSGLERAVYDYNHSDAYVWQVLSVASAYGAEAPRALSQAGSG